MKKDKLILSNKNAIYLFVLFVLLFFAIEFNGLDHIDGGDEHTYFYMGKLVTEGKLPYKDFFNSRPPMQIYVIAAVYKIFGFNLFALKMVPLLAIMISSFFIFKIMKRFSNIIALTSALLFLFSHRVLLEATYFLGVNLTAMFTVIGLYYLMNRKKYFISGLFFGFAGITGLYSLVPIAVVFVLLLIRNKKIFLQFLYGFSLIFFVTNVLFVMFHGVSYIHSVYLYHLFKPKVQGIALNMFFDYFLKNIFLVGFAFLFFFVKDKRKLSLIGLISVFYILFLFIIRSFNFYFVLLAPFLAILGGYSFVNFIKRLRKRNIIIFSVVLLILFGIYAFNISMYMKNYDFIDFQSKDFLVEHIEKYSEENDVIFGDVTFTPLAALLADKSIAFDEVDTNAQRFLSGSLKFDDVLNRIYNEKVKFVIVRPAIGFGNNQKVADFLRTYCKRSLWIKDIYFGEIFVYDCSE